MRARFLPAGLRLSLRSLRSSSLLFFFGRVLALMASRSILPTTFGPVRRGAPPTEVVSASFSLPVAAVASAVAAGAGASAGAAAVSVEGVCFSAAGCAGAAGFSAGASGATLSAAAGAASGFSTGADFSAAFSVLEAAVVLREPRFLPPALSSSSILPSTFTWGLRSSGTSVLVSSAAGWASVEVSAAGAGVSAGAAGASSFTSGLSAFSLRFSSRRLGKSFSASSFWALSLANTFLRISYCASSIFALGLASTT